jgi:hypothetical protein
MTTRHWVIVLRVSETTALCRNVGNRRCSVIPQEKGYLIIFTVHITRFPVANVSVTREATTVMEESTLYLRLQENKQA